MNLGRIEPSQLRPIEPEEYDRLVSLGFFEGERVELVHRAIVTMSPQGAPHIATINRLNMLLAPLLAGRAVVQVQGPLGLGDSRPEPDFAVLEPGDRDDALPPTALCVIEVSQSSVDYDRDVKADLYAAADVPEYWIVDVEGRVVEVHRDPRDGTYRSITKFLPGESITMLRFPDVTLAVSDFVR